MTKTRDVQKLGKEIRAARLEAGLSMQQVADQARISKTMVAYLEHGTIEVPGASTLAAVARALSIDPGRLLDLGGYDLTPTLPTFTPYLRSKYQHLPDAAQAELNSAFERISKKYGYDPDGPAPGADEDGEPM